MFAWKLFEENNYKVHVLQICSYFLKFIHFTHVFYYMQPPSRVFCWFLVTTAHQRINCMILVRTKLE